MRNVQAEVQGVFAEVTRYPLEILDPEANLEQDLGIDSVKLGEVLSVLRERFHLPPELDITREKLVTIMGVAAALSEFLGKNGKHANGSVETHNGKPNGKTAAAAAGKAQSSNGVDHGEVAPGSISTHWGRPSSDSVDRSSHVQGPDHSSVNSHSRANGSNGSNGALAHNGHAPSANGALSHGLSPALNGHSHSAVQSASAPSPARQRSISEITEVLLNVFAEITRYPKEILDPQAGLEEDLGIDSVKLGEVFSVVRERFGISDQLDIPREKLGTISTIAASLQGFLARQAAPASIGKTPEPKAAAGNNADFLTLVVEVFAEVTRYPKEILDPAADLEQDLGIDSVKLGEVFSVLRERYSIPEQLEIPRDKLHSIREIAASLQAYVGGSPAASPAASAAPHVNGHAAVASYHSLEHQASARANGSGSESTAAGLYAYSKPEVKPFTGKVVFVSGSGRGLGKDVAVYLAELGASVVVNSFHSRVRGEETAEEIRSRGGDALHLWGSMANPQHVQRVFDEIESHYGYLDFFVGNASNGMLARLEDITEEHWEKAFRTNIVGLHQSAVRAVRLMRRRGGGKIITLSSPAAHGYVDYFGCMGAVKAAVESLTRSMAIEFARYNVQVNCVSPGPVYGELLNKWPETERLVRQWEENTAYDRLCEARDVSHFIAYLLSEPVKLFTGSVLVLDGGISSQGW